VPNRFISTIVKHPVYVAQTSNNKRDSDAWSLLLLAATVWRFAHMPLGVLITTKWFCDQDVKVVRCEAFTKKMCDRCGSLQKGGDVVATFPVALRLVYGSPWEGCAWGAAVHQAPTSNNKRDCNACCLLLLAPTMWSFAHLLLGFPIVTVLNWKSYFDVLGLLIKIWH